LRDHSHYSPENSGYCAHCGQLLVEHVPAYGDKRFNPAGLAVAVLLHLLLVLWYVFSPETESTAPPPSGTDITYIKELPGKPKQKDMPQAVTKPVKPVKPVKQRKIEVVKVERLKDTITLPDEKPVVREEPEPPKPPKPETIDPAEDMSARIAARQRARGQDTSQQQGEESAADRGNRIARENIAAANGRSKGDDRNETGGVFSITNKSFTGAQLKFRGWNPNFKRRWLQQVDVELGTERDIETAIVKKMIELIRKEKTGDFEWDSHRLQRIVKMSARVEDTAELQAFLYQEMFPAYRPPRTR
jgi:type IV secretory pathway VirB10-like protein